SRHDGNPLLATIESPPPGGADLCDATKAGRALRQAILVVQPGRGRRSCGDAEAALWGRRQQSIRCAELPRSVGGESDKETRGVSVPEFLGTDGRAPLHAVDRALCGRGVVGRGRTAAADARLSAAPRLRAATSWTPCLRLEKTGRRTRCRLRAGAGCREENRCRGLGGQRIHACAGRSADL